MTFMPLRDGFLIYPVALSTGVVARLELPVELTKADAEKISRIVLALALTSNKSGTE